MWDVWKASHEKCQSNAPAKTAKIEKIEPSRKSNVAANDAT